MSPDPLNSWFKMDRARVSWVKLPFSYNPTRYNRLFESLVQRSNPGDNVIYIRGDFVLKNGLENLDVNQDFKNKFRKIKFGNDSEVTVEEVEKWEDIPLNVMRAFSVIIQPDRRGQTMHKYTARDVLRNQVEYPLMDEYKKSNLFEFIDQDTSSRYFWHIEKYTQGLASSPQYRISPSIIYLEKEETFILSGGYVSMSSCSELYLDWFVRELEEDPNIKSRVERFDSGLQMLLRTVENGSFLADDIWMYRIDEKKWELVKPITSLNPNCEVHCFRICSGVHYLETTKCYYLENSFISYRSLNRLMEFDYQSKSVREVKEFNNYFPSNMEYQFSSPIIDYSNSSLLFLIKKYNYLVIVFCLKTFKCIKVELDNWNMKKMDKGVRHWTMTFVDNFHKLVLIPSYDSQLIDKKSDPRDILGIIDWKQVRSRKIDPFLAAIRGSRISGLDEWKYIEYDILKQL